MATVLSDADIKKAQRFQYFGYALIVLAFALPFIAAALGMYSAFDVGQSLATTAGSLLLMAFITWLATRKNSDMAKGIGRLITGILLCVVVGSNLATSLGEEKAAKAFLKESLENNAKQERSFAELGARFDKLGDVSSVMTSTALVNPGELANARAVLAQFRALVAERKALLRANLADSEHFIRTKSSPGAMREGALAAFPAKRDETLRLYADLDVAQIELADSYTAILDYAASQMGKVNITNGRLMFTSQQQMTTFQGLSERAAKAQTRLNEVVVAANAARGKFMETLRKNKADAESLISK